MPDDLDTKANWAKKGTWEDPAIVNDTRIDHEDPVVRAVAERLHGNESMHMHQHISSVICPYCALRASRVIKWTKDVQAELDGTCAGHLWCVAPEHIEGCFATDLERRVRRG